MLVVDRMDAEVNSIQNPNPVVRVHFEELRKLSSNYRSPSQCKETGCSQTIGNLLPLAAIKSREVSYDLHHRGKRLCWPRTLRTVLLFTE